MKRFRTLIALTLATAASVTVCAQTLSTPAAGSSNAAPIVTSALTSAEVVNVHPKEGKVLLKHGPIPNIGMGAMTMEFGVKNKKALAKFKKGDKVRFAADQINGEYVVTHMEAAQ